jgi:hypothetical protein
MPGAPGINRPGSGSGFPGIPGPGGSGNVPGTAPKTGAPAGSHTRTEFIILFIWQEPTPSDKLRESAAAPGTPGAPAVKR